MACSFHCRCGSMVTVSNNGRTAQRNQPAQEFNNGVVLSAEPIRDNLLFEVKIDRKVNSWSGSIEIGVTTCDPDNVVFPTSATGFHEGTWVFSGCSLMRDGHTVVDEYGRDLDQLSEGDRVAVMRTSGAVLHLYVNGVDQGPAATGIPSCMWAVVDMYGKCAQVTVVEETVMLPPAVAVDEAVCHDVLTFHERCGSLVKLSNGGCTAARQRPLDEFNNGVVLTARPLHSDERFEIRIDRLVDKWSGSIEIGVTTHNPNLMEFPATMTNMRSGTIMMSGSRIVTNGKGTRREYGEFNLDELQEGDHIGLVRKSSGSLHYFINSVDQGVAASQTPELVWGVVDLYGMAVQVTVIDVDNDAAVSRRPCTDNNMTNDVMPPATDSHVDRNVNRLLFHPRCGLHAAVMSGQRTAHRPHAVDDFNNAVVLTNRPLRPREMFEIRLDRMVDKWSGSIEIGVTSHSPLDIEFPATMTNIRSGTWMMTGNGVMHNGRMIQEDYGHNLDALKAGDRVGVLRNDDGTLHFYVNGIDQGLASSEVPRNIYGVIDLYGQAAQATIIDTAGHSSAGHVARHRSVRQAGVMLPGTEPVRDMRFHRQRGASNLSLSTDGLTASLIHASHNTDTASVTSCRPLHDDELFEFRIDRVITMPSSASLETGVTNMCPDEIVNRTMTADHTSNLWLLSRSSLRNNNVTLTDSYQLDLSCLHLGSRVGIVRSADSTLHCYLDGIDQGVACCNVPSGVYAVVILNSRYPQVTIVDSSLVSGSSSHTTVVVQEELDQSSTTGPTRLTGSAHQFSTHRVGRNIVLRNLDCLAIRQTGYDGGLIISSEPLRTDDLLQVRIDSVCKKWAGSLQIGLTAVPAAIDVTALSQLSPCDTWFVTRSEVWHNGKKLCDNYCPSLDRVDVNDIIGIKRSTAGSMHLYINGHDLGVAATDIPQTVYAVVDVYGAVTSVSLYCAPVIELSQSATTMVSHNVLTPPTDDVASQSTDLAAAAVNVCGVEESEDVARFKLHGRNIRLSDDGRTAERTDSYNHGIVISQDPLRPAQLFQVHIDHIDDRWSSSLMIGLVCLRDVQETLPSSALDMWSPCWIVCDDSVYRNGCKVGEHIGPCLSSLTAGQTVSIEVGNDASMRLCVNDVDCGVVAHDVTLSHCHVVVDLYGRCDRLSVDSSLVSPAVCEYQEKAAKENADPKEKRPMKHLHHHQLSDAVFQPTTCDYYNLCSRFKATLGLPAGYFMSSSSCCYCEACHRQRSEPLYYRRGDPPKDYSLPIGWSKFTLRVQPRLESLHIAPVDKWHCAYHGVCPSYVRRLLDAGDPLAVCRSSLVGGVMTAGHGHAEKNQPEENDVSQQIVFSPSINYAASSRFTTKFEYTDTLTHKRHEVRLVAQLCVKPGAYKVSDAYISETDDDRQIDAKFSNSELEWSTKERGSTSLTALLIRVD